ncbi:MAG: hypothetical protein CL685_00860 [Candidatus Magasanikbacteria bacterium]|nr:hypothetical protein [Candidatus Magasanikbacteria bacterium]
MIYLPIHYLPLMKNSIVFFCVILCFFLTQPVFGRQAIPFTPNNIISDKSIQDANSMNRADIRGFLRQHNGFLSSFIATDKDGKRRHIADIIYNASKKHQINPKYLLVKLEKEQSLITMKNPEQKRLDWATGYGICDACSKSDPALQKHKGIATQIDSAAAIIRWYYDNMHKKAWIKKAGKTYTIDNTTVIPATNATAFLYTYTPHIQGNKNFWKLWNKWFDQVYPNGSLLRAENDGTIYLIKDTVKHPFENTTAFTTRFDKKDIISVPKTELSIYETGSSISLPNYAILQQGAAFYLLDNDILRPFANRETVRLFGFNPLEFIQVTKEDIAPYALGKKITTATKHISGELIRLTDDNGLYYSKDATLYPIIDSAIATANFPKHNEKPASLSSLGEVVIGTQVLFKDGVLVKDKRDHKVYVIEHGKKRHIASEKDFTTLGYDWENIVIVESFTLMQHQTGQPLYARKAPAPQQVNKQTVVAKLLDTKKEHTTLAEKMYRTPKENTQYIGDVFDTEVDAYLVQDKKTGDILMGKNINTVRPMASFAKVTTAHTLLKKGLNLTKPSVFDPKKHTALYHKFRIAAGEKVFNKDLLDALLVSSLNTPAYMLAQNVSQIPTDIIPSLNTEAKKLGLTNTQFTSITGEEVDTVSTAKEYATLFTTAIKNKTIKAVLQKKGYTYTEFTDLDRKPNHYDYNTNPLVNKNHPNFTVSASKTGFLYESGSNLAMVVTRKSDGKEFVIITMGNPDYPNRFVEPKRLIGYVLSHF